MKKPPKKMPSFNRIILIGMCSLFGVAGIYGMVSEFQNAAYGNAAFDGLIAAINLVILFWVVTVKNTSKEDFEQLMNAPFELPNGKRIEVNDPGWLVSRYPIEGVFETDGSATVAVDLKTYEIHVQNCFCKDGKTFFDGYTVVPYLVIRLDEIESVYVQRMNESPNREMLITTDQGVLSVIDSGSNFSELREFLVENLPAEKTAFRFFPALKKYSVKLARGMMVLLVAGVLTLLILQFI